MSATETHRARVLAYVAAHPAPCRITLGELIEGAGLPRATLYRALKADGGVNAFLISVRLAAAKELLASGLSCKKVSRRCGFKAQPHFSRRFLAAYGLNAGAYRARRQAEAAAARA